MPANDDFLREFFVDCQNAMRHRSETEYKLLNLFMILNAAIISVVIGVDEFVTDNVKFIGVTFSMVAFLTFITILVHNKIKAEHEIYEKLGQQVVKIWEYFELFKKGAYIDNDMILDEEARNYGKGKGYLRTLHILWGMTIITDTILIIFGIIKLASI